MSIEALAQQIAPKPDLLSRMVFEDSIELRPGTDFHDGIVYITVPFLLWTDVQVGKGRQARTERRKLPGTVCLTSDPADRAFEFTEEALDERRFVFPRTFTAQQSSRWPTESVEAYIRGDAPDIDPKQLFETLHEIYVTHIEFADDAYYTMLPLYVMGSYLFRLFSSVGYLHFNGTAASGKSQNLRLLKAFALNTTWASNMSVASLYRQTAGWPGVFCVDEAEDFKSEKGAELKLLLNAGYLKSSGAQRVEKIDERFFNIEYATFGPKVLASIAPLEPVLQSRCIVVQMTPAIRPIPEFDADAEQWADVRSQLYLFALQHGPDVANVVKHWNQTKRHTTDLPNRTWQITQLYLTLADYIGGDAMVEPLLTFFADYFVSQQKAADATDVQRQVLQALPRTFATKPTIDGEWLALADIHEVLLDYLDEDQKEYQKTYQVSRHLQTLGFKRRKPAKGGVLVGVTQDEVRAALKRRRVEPHPEDQAWFDSGENYHRHDSPSTEEATLFEDLGDDIYPKDD